MKAFKVMCSGSVEEIHRCLEIADIQTLKSINSLMPKRYLLLFGILT